MKDKYKQLFLIHFCSGTEHRRENNPDLYYCPEITGTTHKHLHMTYTT